MLLLSPQRLTANYTRIYVVHCIPRVCWYVIWWEPAEKHCFIACHDCNLIFYWLRGPRRHVLSQSEGAAYFTKIMAVVRPWSCWILVHSPAKLSFISFARVQYCLIRQRVPTQWHPVPIYKIWSILATIWLPNRALVVLVYLLIPPMLIQT